MFSRSAAVGSTKYFSVSSYKKLRRNKRTMQEKITSNVSVSVMILGVSLLCDDWSSVMNPVLLNIGLSRLTLSQM